MVFWRLGRKHEKMITPESHVWLYTADCVELMRSWPENSVDAVVCDPPYLIGYNGHDWDKAPKGEHTAWHRLWLDQAFRVLKPGGYCLAFGATRAVHRMTVAAEDAGFQIRDAIAWLYMSGVVASLTLPDGGGTALKPAREDIIMGRKPPDGTLLANLARWGTGRLNIEASRVNTRWPSNVIVSDEVSAALAEENENAALFFYVAKPSGRERDLGCEDLPVKSGGEATGRVDDSAGVRNPRAGAGRGGGRRNTHATIKSVQLMRYLIRLVTPTYGIVLDPFLGSGTTGIAARLEQRQFVGVEREAEYVEIAKRRIAAADRYLDL